MTVSEKDVSRVAELANLELTADESSRMLRDLNSILGHITTLNELDTTSVLPMAQVGELVKEWTHSESPASKLRSDDVMPSLDRDQVLCAAPETDHVFFKVPKVIER